VAAEKHNLRRDRDGNICFILARRLRFCERSLAVVIIYIDISFKDETRIIVGITNLYYHNIDRIFDYI